MPPIVMSSELIPPESGAGSLGRQELESSEGNGRIATMETLWSFFIDMVSDPDMALAKDPDAIQKLMRHPQVSACMNIREQKIASMLSRVDPPEDPIDKGMAEAAAKYVKRVWNSLADKDSLFQNFQQAVLQGGVGHEWEWEYRKEDGTQRPYAFTPISKTRFTFTREGELCLRTRGQPVWGGYLGIIPTRPGKAPRHQPDVPIGKFSYHAYERSWGTWHRPDEEGFYYYGRGEDEDLFDLVMRDFATWFMEQQWLAQYGNPPRLLYHPHPVAQWKATIKNFAQRLRTDSLVPLPGLAEGTLRAFELIDAKVPNPTTDAFGQSRKRNFDSIEAILLGSVGVLSQQDKGGYAGHQSRQQSGPDMLAGRDARRIESTLNSQWVPAVLRYGPAPFRTMPKDDYPQIRLYNEEQVDIEVLEKAVTLVPVAKSTIYRHLRIEQPKMGEDGQPAEEVVFLGQQQDPYGELEELKDGGEPADEVDQDEPRKPIGHRKSKNGKHPLGDNGDDSVDHEAYQ